MKILIILFVCVVGALANVKVLNEINVKINNFSYYTIQTVCKDGYQYTVVINGTNIGITQDFKASSTSTSPRVIECENDK